MPDVQSYVWVSVDTNDLLIYGGPFGWDGETEIDVPEGEVAMLTDDAINDGYAFPVVPVSPAETMATGLSAGLGANTGWLAAGPHTAAEAHAQVEVLTRQVDALIRLTQGWTDTTDGT